MAAMYYVIPIPGVVLSYKRYFIHSNRNGADTYVRYVSAMDLCIWATFSIKFRFETIDGGF